MKIVIIVYSRRLCGEHNKSLSPVVYPAKRYCLRDCDPVFILPMKKRKRIISQNSTCKSQRNTKEKEF